MDKNVFNDLRHRIERYVSEKRLKNAFDTAQTLAVATSNRKLQQELTDAEQDYRYMLDFTLKGTDDPGRDDMSQQLGSRILSIVDRMEREMLRADTPAIYFNTLRYEASQRNDSIPQLIEDYRKTAAENSLFNYVVSGAHSDKFRSALEHREMLERRIFNRVWTVHLLSAEQLESIGKALTDDALPAAFRTMLVWALTLGGLQYYDENRITLLLDCYAKVNDGSHDNTSANTIETEKLSAAAITGILLLLHRGRARGYSKRIVSRINLLSDMNGNLRSDLHVCYLEFAKTIDTERISKKISNEIVPEILKMKPDIDKKIKSDGSIQLDLDDLEENPEWAEMLENSELADKLREMSEIQEEGGDVMMATFSHLKTFPFFNEPYGWFIPFHADCSEFAGRDAALMQPMAELLDKAPFLCDSDKYSFMFSIKQVPQAQRDVMLQQFHAHGDHIAEMQAATLSVGAERKNTINKTVQNVFRFFTLFRRKGEFFNPFAEGVNLVEIEPLKPLISETGILPLIAEYYFSHGYFPQAASTFTAMADDAAFKADDQYYQKLGYALQKSGNNSKALENYMQAELLNPKNLWTLTRLANLLLATGNASEALQRYLEIEKRNPQRASTALQIARCHAALGNVEEALRAYFKAEYLGAKPERVLRPLAWTLLKSGDIERAQKYYEKVILTLKPEASDYLNMGHIALAKSNLEDAMAGYMMSVATRHDASSGEKYNGDTHQAIESLIADIRADIPVLKSLGIDTSVVPLIIDALIYKL